MVKNIPFFLIGKNNFTIVIEGETLYKKIIIVNTYSLVFTAYSGTVKF